MPFMEAVVRGQGSPYRKAMALAQRLVGIGINPFQSENERYIVLLDDGTGEIIEWGKPLRGTRFFAPNAIRKDKPLVAEFEAFANRHGLQDCVYWGVGLTGAKADPDHLEAALKSFNDRINVEFSELRKSGKFELLLLVIHPRYDEFSEKFDLHAHFVARVPIEHRDAVKHRLTVKFSKTDFPDNPIRKAAAVATYMLWGIFRNDIMVFWPDHALKAVWGLTQGRFRFVRSGGSFAKWKASKVPSADKPDQLVDQAQKRRNRAETADPRQKVVNDDRLLSKIMVKIRGVRTAALLFEAAPKRQASDIHADGKVGREYSSAANIVTQESATDLEMVGSFKCSGSIHPIWDGLKTLISRITEPVSSWTQKISTIGKSLLKRPTS